MYLGHALLNPRQYDDATTMNNKGAALFSQWSKVLFSNLFEGKCHLLLLVLWVSLGPRSHRPQTSLT